MRKLDRIDLAILDELQTNARVTNHELSNRVNLSPTPCLERVRKLERDGYIKHYRAILHAGRLGMGLVVFVEVCLTRTGPDVFAQFKQAAIRVPEIQECHLVSGNFDYLIKARVADIEQYRTLLGETILALPGVKDSRSYIVMETCKEGQELDIKSLTDRAGS
ncbi:leucine-responsive transcriptional regulator [Marinobacter psychrophilus]|jgi:Lrp/AsnC family leucine-responsive transcriptional regulator|uniref:Leucine-responsive regulatory protein n=1 Tax=Marinobacter psychrophilus TaxID=330734 RepID=A0A0H4I867_9GAMM|nr:Lrp/AsnC ligand binding domain-containing protein [Marinobacter psychrophilus]AKO51247.1 leucine-responsive transcriptional regulator [Marinobacter psychrophilus]MBQ0761809.1 Lrp/AsnC ligand binding domain-containing protein [Marinobacter psychrophilus]MBQ0846467.1 Lrp/AsnC ligand binding domain-containing protein [Marinobacter psychrophilus]